MTITLSALQKQRWDTAANWTAENPTLLAGEIGIESDTGYWKVGNGSTAWTSLAYVSGLGAEIPVDRLADGTAGQIIQTDSAGTGVEWSSTANLPLGSASAPAYRFQGDANTGIYSPGADQLAISTNGTGRLFVDSNGATRIESVSVPLTSSRTVSGSNLGGLILRQSDTTNGNSLRIEYQSDTTGTGAASNVAFAGIEFAADTHDQATRAGSIRFRTSQGGVGDMQERLRITSDGKLGLGTSAPVRVFHVVAASAPVARFERGTNDGAIVEIRDFNNVTVGSINSASSTVGFYGSGNGGINIDASNRVGIGTTSPNTNSKLHVVGDILITGTNARFNAGIDGSASNPTFVVNDGDTGMYRAGANAIGFATGGTAAVTIDSSQRVGIGTTTVGKKLVINHGAGDGVMLIAPNTAESTIYFGDTDDDDVGRIIYDHSINAMKFRTNTSEAARIDSSGRLGLGTSSPGSELEIAGGSTTAGPGAELRLTSKDQTIAAADEIIGSITFNNSDASSGTAGVMAKIDAASNRIFDGDNASGMNLRFFAGDKGDGVGTPPERMRITTEGRVGIGTASPSKTLEVIKSSSGGTTIQFTDAVNATGRLGTPSAAVVAFGGNTDHNIVFGGWAVDGNSLASERVRIDTSGRLLVGTSTARTAWNNTTIGANIFQIERGGNGSDAALSICANSGTASSTVTAAVVYLGKTRGTTAGATDAVASGDCLGRVSFQGSDGTEQVEAAKIEAFVDGTPGANDMPGRLVFSTTADGASSPTERMRVNRNGVTSVISTETTFVSSTTQGAGTSYKTFSGKHSGTTPGTGTETFLVWSNGDVANTNNTYGAISDIKLKENIVDANSQWNDLKALQVRNYNFKEGQTHTQIGLIAQEVELVSPGLVSESPDRDEDGNDLGTVTKSVNYSVLYMKAVKALQEAMERIEVLEAKVNALEGN